jgi:hypothetical protein
VPYLLTFKVSIPFVLEKAKGTQNQPDLIVAQVFQIFPSFTPGERQGKRISHTLLLHVHVLLEKDKGTGLLHSK